MQAQGPPDGLPEANTEAQLFFFIKKTELRVGVEGRHVWGVYVGIIKMAFRMTLRRARMEP